MIVFTTASTFDYTFAQILSLLNIECFSEFLSMQTRLRALTIATSESAPPIQRQESMYVLTLLRSKDKLLLLLVLYPFLTD